MQDNTKIVLMAIGCLTLLEAVALSQGINGTYFSMIVAAVAGLAGFQLRPYAKGVLDVLRRKPEPGSE